MSQMMQLDALVTMLACLTTTHSDLGSHMLPVDNTTAGSCPLAALSSLTTQIQKLSTGIASTKEQIGLLQEQLAELRRFGTPQMAAIQSVPISIGTRSADLEPLLLEAALASTADSMGGLSAAKESITPRNCLKQDHGSIRIRLDSNIEPFFVFCDQKTRGGGWTVVANRYDGSEVFNRTWSDYKIGFGPLAGEFFMGLEKLYQITTSYDNELLVEMKNAKHDFRSAVYDHFGIGSEVEQYRLKVLGKYQGDAGDALRQHMGKKFSTYDKKSDESEINCALEQSGAFWFGNSCNLSNPFGLYPQGALPRDFDGYMGILWHGFLNGPKGSLKTMRMLVRPRNKDS